jgi:hypothetical protein
MNCVIDVLKMDLAEGESVSRFVGYFKGINACIIVLIIVWVGRVLRMGS